MDIDERKIGEWPNVALIPGTHIHAATGEHVEQPESTRIGHHRNVDDMDTREKLEADICDWLTHDLQGNPLYEAFADSVEPGSMPEIRRWLNRQAAITRRECSPEAIDNMLNEIGELEEQVAELTTELDKLCEKNSNQRRQLSELQDAIHERNEGVLKRQWQHRINELTAERDHLKDVVKVQANSFAKLEQELAEAKSKLKAVER